MKNFKILLALFLISTPLMANQCIGLGKNCISPFLDHLPCCEGLSCKAVPRNHFKCYPKQCVEVFGSCDPKGAPCCEGKCVLDADQQQVCK